MFPITRPSLLDSQYYFRVNLHTIMEDILVKVQKIFLKNVRLNFLKIMCQIHYKFIKLKESSKPRCHSKPFITQCPYGHQQRTHTLRIQHRPQECLYVRQLRFKEFQVSLGTITSCICPRKSQRFAFSLPFNVIKMV